MRIICKLQAHDIFWEGSALFVQAAAALRKKDLLMQYGRLQCFYKRHKHSIFLNQNGIVLLSSILSQSLYPILVNFPPTKFPQFPKFSLIPKFSQIKIPSHHLPPTPLLHHRHCRYSLPQLVSLQPSKNGTALKVQKDVAKKPAALLRLGLSYARVKLISDSNLLRAWIFSDSDLLQNTPNSEETNSEQQTAIGSSNVSETPDEPAKIQSNPMSLQKFKLKVVGRAEVEDLRYLKIYTS
ncbi:uncharacterized protein [Gossypium hirsutum]|uniref:Uncharacterized protein n=1 Tax=Gossypium hirsutum TaxID=3635 RepID=A0ABM2YNL9_GOSHI|nr:uncharacterized protein LOC107889485 [Gossypium hirsutum]